MIGRKIANFQIIEELGSGGMGTVYKAKDINLKRFVAIKVLHASLLKKESNYKRFKNEAEISAQINHPNVATLFNFLEIDGHAYIIMEYVDGITLEELIIQKGPLCRKEGINLTCQILKGISAAHQLNILHRDLKPANIMISGNGYVKIMDFGIALMGNSTRLTTQNKIIGTLYYMAPELFSGKLPSVSSDLYAVGIMFFEILTGKALFDADSEAALMYQIINEKPHFKLNASKKNLSPILNKLVHKTVSRRYTNAQTVVTILEESKENQRSIPRLEIPSFVSVIQNAKRKFRAKTNFAKQENIVKVSNDVDKKNDLKKKLKQKYALAGMAIASIALILAFNYSSESSIITGGNYETTQIVQATKVVEASEIDYPKIDSKSNNTEDPSPNSEHIPIPDPAIELVAALETETKVESRTKPENRKIDIKKEQSYDNPRSEDSIVNTVEKKVNTIEIPVENNSNDKDSDFIEAEIKTETKTIAKTPTKISLREQRISLRFPNEVRSADFEVGQEILLETNQEVVSKEVVVIPKYAKAIAQVTKKRVANSGKVTFGIKFKKVQAVNGEWLKLKYPEYSDIQKGEVIFEKGRTVSKVTVQAKKINLIL